MQINSKYEIFTPSGFQKFSGIRNLKKESYFDILLSNGKRIKCSLNHPFICDEEIVYSYDLRVGSKINSAGFGYVIVEDINLKNGIIDLYDIVDVDCGNLFCVDGIISHNCDFITSGDTVIEGAILRDYGEQFILPPVEMRGIEHGYWIWKYPDYSRDYMVVADVARGDGTDFSAFHVIDIESNEQVAEYKGKIGTNDYGNFLVSVATEYNNALLIIENASVGWAAIQPAIDRGYQNLFYSNRNSELLDPDSFIKKGFYVKDKADQIAGFTTSARTRPLVISKLELYFRERSVIAHSQRLMDELSVFVWTSTGRAEARKGYNDDLVMSFGIGMYIRDTAFKLRQQSMELSRSSIASISSTVYIPKDGGKFLPQNPWEMKYGQHQINLKDFI